MDGRSTSDIDSVERFVFFVPHLSCFSFFTVSKRVKSHKTIFTFYSEDSVAAVAASGSCSSDTVPAQECLNDAILGESSILMGVVSRIKATKQTAIHNELFVNNFGCRN